MGWMKKSFLTTRSCLITEVSQGTSVIWEKLYQTVQSLTMHSSQLPNNVASGSGQYFPLLTVFEVPWIPWICKAAQSIS